MTPRDSSPMTDHKVIGTLFVVAALAFLAVSAVAGLVAKDDLGGPFDLVADSTLRELFNMPGIALVLLVVLPLWLGLATALVPLQIGATRMAFPRVHALAFYLFTAGGVMLLIAPRTSDLIRGMALGSQIPDSAAFRGDGPTLAILGLGLVLTSAVVVATDLVVTVLALRAPGLTVSRTPLFSFSTLVSSLVIILAAPVMMAALLMLLLDGHYGGNIFNGFTGSKGGNPLLWPRIFWFGAYPLLWALLLPALGAVADMVPPFSHRRLFSHPRALAATTGVGVLAFFGWGSQVASLSRARPLFALGVLVGLLPVASLVLNWLMTVFAKSAERADGESRTPPSVPTTAALLTALVVLAGLGVAAIAALDSAGDLVGYWWSAAQHLLFIGAPLVAAVGALHYWAPKLWGRKLSVTNGRLSAAAIAAGSLLAFLPLVVVGAQDIGLDLDSFNTTDGWGPALVASSAGLLILGLGLVVLVADLLVSVVAGKGEEASDNPWGGFTLEWATTSPPPPRNFTRLPEVRSEVPLLEMAVAEAGHGGESAADGSEPEPVAVG